MNDLGAPLTPEEAARAANAGTTKNDCWTREEIAAQWDKAETKPGELSTDYMVERGLDLGLIGPDEMRTASHQSRKGVKKFPALLFAGTNDDGAVERVQAIRFGTDRKRLPKTAKITKRHRGGPIPVLCLQRKRRPPFNL